MLEGGGGRGLLRHLDGGEGRGREVGPSADHLDQEREQRSSGALHPLQRVRAVLVHLMSREGRGRGKVTREGEQTRGEADKRAALLPLGQARLLRSIIGSSDYFFIAAAASGEGQPLTSAWTSGPLQHLEDRPQEA